MARRTADTGDSADTVEARGRIRGKQHQTKKESESESATAMAMAMARKEVPPKRATRARTKAQANDHRDADGDGDGDDGGDTVEAKEGGRRAPSTTTTTETGRKRGRPKGSTTTAKGKTKSATAARAGAVAAAKRVDDGAEGGDACSSDDEMDVVTTVRAGGNEVAARGGTGPGTRKGAAASGKKPGTSTSTSGSTRTAAKGQGRPRVVEDEDEDDDDELAQFDVSLPRGIRGQKGASSRGAAAAPASAQSSTTSATRQRGRPKKAATATAASSTSDKPAPASRQSKKATSTAPAPGPAAAQTTSSTTSKSKPKKKVTFLDFTEPSDKENLPTPAPSEKKGIRKTGGVASTGMAGKPARRPATPVTATPGSASGRKSPTGSAPASADGTTAGLTPPKEPLSPKKATQVSKSGSSGGSEDNATQSDEQKGSGSRGSPARRASMSPMKQVSSLSASLGSPAKKVDIGASVTLTAPGRSSEEERRSTEENGEVNSPTGKEGKEPAPVCLKDSVIASSPARRPPPSPHKDLMKKESPRKAPLLIAPDVSSTPRKSTNGATSSPLKLSPKKVQFGGTPGRGSASASASSPGRRKDKMQSSLLLTPAKRPVLAPTPLSSRMKPPQASPEMDDALGGDEGEMQLDQSQDMRSAGVATEMEVQHDDDDDVQYPDMEESVLEISHLNTQQHAHGGYEVAATGSPQNIRSDSQFDDDGDDPFVISEANSAMHTPQRSWAAVSADSSVNSASSFRGVPPPAPSPPVSSAVTSPPQRFGYREDIEPSESEAESCMEASPMDDGTSSPSKTVEHRAPPEKEVGEEDLGFTPLAAKLSQWNATSPDKRQSRRYRLQRPFSPVPAAAGGPGGKRPRDSLDSKHSMDVRRRSGKGRTSSFASAVGNMSEASEGTPTLARVFDGRQEESAAATAPEHGDTDGTPSKLSEKPGCSIGTSRIYEDDGQIPTPGVPAVHDESATEGGIATNDTMSVLGQAEAQEAFEEETEISEDEGETEVFGDENVMPPSDPTVTLPASLFEDNSNEPTPVQRVSPVPRTSPLPMSVTPVRRDPAQPRTAHTVSKAPLRPDGDGGLNVSKKRSRSMSPGVNKNGQIRFSPRKSNRRSLKPFDLEKVPEPSSTPNFSKRAKSATPRQSPARSPAKSSARKRQEGSSSVLRGAVVYADVHTSDGADASGIFVELLSQMGARCVKSWGWNPRTASLSPPADGDGGGDHCSAVEATKVGITHVVYKDGGVRTLEKVREANGVVKCVGVGWVLEYVLCMPNISICLIIGANGMSSQLRESKQMARRS